MNLHHRNGRLGLEKTGTPVTPKQSWTAGVNDTWIVDQRHNLQWDKFQLFFHLGIEPYSGCLLWLKCWWTNRDPRLLCGWYLDAIERMGYSKTSPL